MKSTTAQPRRLGQAVLDPNKRQRVLLLPFGFFAMTLLLALVLAGLNALFGSVNRLPGENLMWPALALIAFYVWGLYVLLCRVGLQGSEFQRIRQILIAVSTLAASPVIGWLIAPGLNGLMASGPEVVEVVPVQRFDTSYVKNKRLPHYYAIVAAGATSAALPAGRYFMGRYDAAWRPGDDKPLSDIKRVAVRYRPGLLGARTLLEAVPAD